MPEHAALAIRDGSVGGGRDSFPHSKILMISTEDFRVAGEANEVFDNVEKARLVKDPLNKGVKLGVLRILVAAVLRFPFHKSVFACRNTSGFGDGEVAHHEESVIDEQRWYLVHIVPQLQKRLTARETAAQTLDEVRRAMKINYFDDANLIAEQAKKFKNQ